MIAMNGYVLIDKPQNWTSFDIVAKVRGLARAANRQTMADGAKGGQQLAKRVKVGHTGTLDPMATGLLVVLVGTYTKRATELTKLDKTYEVTMKLGETSTTGDQEGEIMHISDRQPSSQEIQAALSKYVGEIMQTPPAFSAMKIDGKRAYELARAGKEVKLEARPVTIHETTLTSYEYPYVRFTSHVGSGTYIRSLVEDLGSSLQTGAYMSDLRRTKVGAFDIADAAHVSDLTADTIAQQLQILP
jgi:tRNA pseudouridine55 synthase